MTDQTTTIFVQYSPINQAWFVLFGDSRKPAAASVLRVFSARTDADAFVGECQS